MMSVHLPTDHAFRVPEVKPPAPWMFAPGKGNCPQGGLAAVTLPPPGAALQDIRTKPCTVQGRAGGRATDKVALPRLPWWWP